MNLNSCHKHILNTRDIPDPKPRVGTFHPWVTLQHQFPDHHHVRATAEPQGQASAGMLGRPPAPCPSPRMFTERLLQRHDGHR